MSSQSEDTVDGQVKSKPFSVSLSSSKGGTKKTSFNLESSSCSSNKAARLPCRPHHIHEHDESDEDERPPTHEVVTEFDSSVGGAIPADGGSSDGVKRELVIKVESKNNWRDRPGVNRRSRGKNLLPQEVQAQQQAQREGQTGAAIETEGPNMEYGLSYARQAAVPPDSGEKHTLAAQNDGNTRMEDIQALGNAQNRQPLTQDEIALQALIRDSRGDGEERRSDLIIASSKPTVNGDTDGDNVRYDETSSFRADVATRPDPASLDDYNAIPVEEFGAALLRGMGWKDGQAIGRGRYELSNSNSQPHVPARRPGFLGIGAKDLSGGKGAEAEIGAWGKAAMRKSSKKSGNADSSGGNEGVYIPVLMKSKKTGEYITEEEFKTRQKDSKDRKGEEDEWRERRDRNLGENGRDRDGRRGHYDDIEEDRDLHDKRRKGASRRDRSRSSGDRDRRSRRYEDGDGNGRDSRHYRERDRYRDQERERERDWDRGRDRNGDRKYRDSTRGRNEDQYSSRHSSSTPSRRDRDRDHDRDRRDRDPYRKRENR